MSESDLTFERVFRYCDNAMSDMCDHLEIKFGVLYDCNFGVLYDFNSVSEHIWNKEEQKIFNFPRKVDITSKQEFEDNFGYEARDPIIVTYEETTFYEEVVHKNFVNYEIDLFVLKTKSISSTVTENLKYQDDADISISEKYNSYIFVVYNQERIVPFGEVFGAVGCINYDLIKDPIESITIAYGPRGGGNNPNISNFITKDNKLLNNMSPYGEDLKELPQSVLLKSSKTLTTTTLYQSKIFDVASNMRDQSLLNSVSLRNGNKDFYRECSDYFIFIPRKLIKENYR